MDDEYKIIRVEDTGRQVRTYEINAYVKVSIIEPELLDKSPGSVPFLAAINKNGETQLHSRSLKFSKYEEYNVNKLKRIINEIYHAS